MLTRKVLITSAILMTGVLYAQDIELKTTESWSDPTNIKKVEDGCLEVTGRKLLVSATTFKIDTAKTYKISGELRQTAGEKIHTHIGFMISDEKKRNMTALTFNIIPSTDTELIEDIKPTDTTIKVKDAAKWEKYARNSRVALNTADDYSDLPNFIYIVPKIIDIQKDGDVWVITFDKATKKAAKAGSKVRLHGAGGYIYTGGSHVITTGDGWKGFNGSIKGHNKYGFGAYKAWPPGAVYARVIILANWNSSTESPSVLQLKDIKVEAID